MLNLIMEAGSLFHWPTLVILSTAKQKGARNLQLLSLLQSSLLLKRKSMLKLIMETG